ncbi:hypothetical protein [Sutterella sp.]|uniref:hypothetical protein n=1 Tax=Sutterella sp. TaxID=1981025 RepID=UPI003FD70B54
MPSTTKPGRLRENVAAAAISITKDELARSPDASRRDSRRGRSLPARSRAPRRALMRAGLRRQGGAAPLTAGKYYLRPPAGRPPGRSGGRPAAQ